MNVNVEELVDFIYMDDSHLHLGLMVIDGRIQNSQIILESTIWERTIRIDAPDLFHIFVAPSILVLGCMHEMDDKEDAMNDLWDKLYIFCRDLGHLSQKERDNKLLDSGFAEQKEHPGYFTKRLVDNQDLLQGIPFVPVPKVCFAEMSVSDGGIMRKTLLGTNISYQDILNFGTKLLKY